MVDGMAYVSMIELADVLAVNPRLLRSEPLRRCDFPSCRAACCLYGVWVDLAEKKRIIAQKAEISSLLPASHHLSDTWFETTVETDPHTRTGGWCTLVLFRMIPITAAAGVFSCSRNINARSRWLANRSTGIPGKSNLFIAFSTPLTWMTLAVSPWMKPDYLAEEEGIMPGESLRSQIAILKKYREATPEIFTY